MTVKHSMAHTGLVLKSEANGYLFWPLVRRDGTSGFATATLIEPCSEDVATDGTSKAMIPKVNKGSSVSADRSTRRAYVYKIVRHSDWCAAQAAGMFAGSADDRRDGFIHLSTADQVASTLEHHFAGASDLLLVAFDAAALGAALRFEKSRNGAMFPHFYGPLPTAAALWQKRLPMTAQGNPSCDPAWHLC